MEEKCRQILMFWAQNYSDREIASFLQYKTAECGKTSRLRCLEDYENCNKTE
ncbi:MAG: hypothetical protein WDM78_19825 [Puia sp.]